MIWGIKTRSFKPIVFALVYLLALSAAAQKRPSAKIAVMARSAKDSILLRWAPDNVTAWQQLNKNGYFIKRYTVLKADKLVEKPEGVLLTPQAIKPLPPDAWKPFIEADDRYASIAAQALYGEDFVVTQETKGDVATLINKVQENESRFSFALFSADQSFKVAQMMGLGLVDKTARADEKYLYRIYPAQLDGNSKIDTGFAYIGLADYTPLPKPYDLQVEAQEKGVFASWNQEAFESVYTAYLLERSEDGGKTFLAVSDAPVINPSADVQQRLRRASLLDTVSALNRKLVYRVKGISPFGEIGPPSDTASIIAIHRLQVVPSITQSEVINNKQVVLNWRMPESPASVLGFDVERSDNPNKGYQKINKTRLGPAVFTIADTKPLSVNYYRIKAYGQKESTYSFPVLVQLVDSIPPVPPVDLAGEITKEGVVILHWKANEEVDIYGYRVFRANNPDEEFVQVSRHPVKETLFTDTIEAKTLAKRIYYKLVALDKHFNPSGFSKHLELKRPDLVPPVPPSFTEVESKADGVYLAWNPSSSDDVIRHELYRTPADKEDWALVKSFADTTHRYTDASADFRLTYTYKVRAVDQALLTTDSQPFSAKKLDLGIRPSVTNLKAVADRSKMQLNVSWTYKEAGVESFLLYRAEPGKPMRLYKTLEGIQTKFTDTDLLINTRYQYRVKVVFQDGSESGFSKLLEADY